MNIRKFMTSDVSGREAEFTYELFATANHAGGANGGHCYSWVLKDGQWYVCDDMHVKRFASVSDTNNYVLFYRQVVA
jgi:ubiquitin C-terminal hydrolase